jgi:CMD domain protein
MTSTISRDTRRNVERTDIVNELAGVRPATPLHELRGERPDVARYAQVSYLALLEPIDEAGVSRFERQAIALRVGVLAGSEPVAEHHREQLRQLGVPGDRIAAIERFPHAGELSHREAAILRHVDLLTQQPREAGEEDIANLREAGLGARDIVTISQLIAFLSFQVRLLAGLRALGEE